MMCILPVVMGGGGREGRDGTGKMVSAFSLIGLWPTNPKRTKGPSSLSTQYGSASLHRKQGVLGTRPYQYCRRLLLLSL